MLAAIAGAEGAKVERPQARPDATLLPRSVLFANPDRLAPALSPDGKKLAFLSARDGVLNVWVAPVSDPSAAAPVTGEKKRGIRSFTWAYTSEHVLYPQDEGGDENWHLYSVHVGTGQSKDLTPAAGAQARLLAISHRVPTQVLVGLNDRDKRYHDAYRVDVVTGAKKLVLQNDGFSTMSADGSLAVRVLMRPTSDGGSAMMAPDGKGGFRELGKVGIEDARTTHVVGFDGAGAKAYLVDSRGRDTAALVEMDLADPAKTKVLLDDGQADVTDIVQHPSTLRVQAALATYEKLRVHALDPALRADLDVIQAVVPGEVRVSSRSQDDARWVVQSTVSDGPIKYWLYDRSKKKVDLLFSNMKALEDAPLAPMVPVTIPTKDGLSLVSYLTLPRGEAADGGASLAQGKAPLPLVLLVHGGPWARDRWGLSPMHQWLASRGYAVLSVNYRGSTGFGKRFVNAGDKEWAGRMHDDLLTAVDWAVTQKIAEPSRVAIMGGSYGGYATLVGLTFTPDRFACGVDIVGPSNLTTLLEAIPPYWASEVEEFTRRIGDHRTEEGKKFLASRSPLTFASRISRPLLIGQGKNDPRVKQAESDRIVAAMEERGIPVTYVLYPDEGHGFARPENRTSFNAVAEIFLAQCLGGPYLPIGADLQGSSITVPVGKERVTTLADALR